MVIAYHLIWTAYGCWLPNDPSGSTSHELREQSLAELGPVHFGRKKLQPRSSTIRAFYQQADEVLKHPRLFLEESDFAIAAQGLAAVIEQQHYTCYECAIMPDHVHLLIRRHRDRSETMIELCQAESRQALIDAGRRTATHPVWTLGGWKGFLNTPDDIRRTIQYIRDNPTKAGLPAQYWEFVKEYDGWCPPPR